VRTPRIVGDVGHGRMRDVGAARRQTIGSFSSPLSWSAPVGVSNLPSPPAGTSALPSYRAPVGSGWSRPSTASEVAGCSTQTIGRGLVRPFGKLRCMLPWMDLRVAYERKAADGSCSRRVVIPLPLSRGGEVTGSPCLHTERGIDTQVQVLTFIRP
jgi:hypothetical protein